MIIGIIGSGGREHAICKKIFKSEKVKKIYCFPGNAGTNEIAENVEIDLSNFNKLKEFIINKKISLIVVGPEKPLVDGIVDYLENNNIKVFGPNKIASQLEGSKTFTKMLCKKYKIPTASFEIFEIKKKNHAFNFVDSANFPMVIKADGLAAGKGVYICQNKTEAKTAIKEIFEGKFGLADKVLIEEFLQGEEMSYFIVSDGKTIKCFGTAQDHKRVLEGDKGKNTGGMGAYSPSRLINSNLEKKILDKIIKPTLKGIKEMKKFNDDDLSYKGFLYAGLMIVNNEPYLIEYNVRMGDPECQTILPKLKSDIVDIFLACCEHKLHLTNIEWYEEKSLCIVLCSKGYPEKYNNNLVIENLNKINLESNEFIYHAGTKTKQNKIYSNGGRVLNFTVLSNNFKKSRDRAIQLIKKLNWQNGYFRTDIGYKVIK